ncbi:MAG: hypothetical protein E7D59_26420, partial [Klebsiella michiganensis]|nr:hypothetical protein [Klebsiella michiganensis]MDU2416838.1 hypothetical protein [Klebsiella michiganensis]
MEVITSLFASSIKSANKEILCRQEKNKTLYVQSKKIKYDLIFLSKRPPSEKVAFENAPCKGGYCHLPLITLAIPS